MYATGAANLSLDWRNPFSSATYLKGPILGQPWKREKTFWQQYFAVVAERMNSGWGVLLTTPRE